MREQGRGFHHPFAHLPHESAAVLPRVPPLPLASSRRPEFLICCRRHEAGGRALFRSTFSLSLPLTLTLMSFPIHTLARTHAPASVTAAAAAAEALERQTDVWRDAAPLRFKSPRAAADYSTSPSLCFASIGVDDETGLPASRLSSLSRGDGTKGR